MYKKIILLLAIISFVPITWAQSTASEDGFKQVYIGDKVPNIVFGNARNFPAGVKSLFDLKGKWVLLDFWGIGCVSCLQAFPKMAELQVEFEADLQIILINAFSSDGESTNAISKLKNEDIKNSYFSLPSSNDSSNWLKLFPHEGVPHHVWISPEGKVAAITGGHNATVDNVRRLLKGDVVFSEKTDLHGYDIAKRGLIIKGHHKLPDPEVYSVFMGNIFGLGSGTYLTEDTLNNTFRCTQRNMSIPTLYRLASKQRNIIVEAEHIPNHNEYVDTDEWQNKNLYTYELVIPLSEKLKYRKYMWEDLNRYFALKENVEGVLEKRTRKAYVLTYSEDKLNIQSSKGSSKPECEQLQWNVGLLISFIKRTLGGSNIILDESGLKTDRKLNFALPDSIKDMATLREFIVPYGFDIIIDDRSVEVLVIKAKEERYLEMH